MKLSKKLNTAMLLLVVCLVLVIGASYAWLTMATSPEVESIETNVGANGSLEIALLTAQTFEDPLQIRSAVGDSAAKQDVLESNKSWGNVIELADVRYGLDQITLLPARLNVQQVDGKLLVGRNLLKTAEYGIDGRIKILDDETVSAVMEGDKFTYYVEGQRYGVRAIGTISNITAQQKALATARTLVKSYSAAASRTVKHTWRDYGAGIVDIFYRHYALGENKFTNEDAQAIQNFAFGMLEATEYIDNATRQLIVAMAASQMADETEFERLCSMITMSSGYSLADCLQLMGSDQNQEAKNWALLVDGMKGDAQQAAELSYTLFYQCDWDTMETVLRLLLNPHSAYLGDKLLSDPEAFSALTQDNLILLPVESGVMARIANFTGNFSAFTTWKESISIEARTTADAQNQFLLRMEALVDNLKAATGGWTRTNLDDLYGFAIDLAFRCNEPSQLLLQTYAASRVDGQDELSPVYGQGSYMFFYSEHMSDDQLVKLMDTIRIGFISGSNELLAVAKLGNYAYDQEEEGRASGRLHLYNFHLEDNGSIIIGERREDNAILELHQNSPAIITVVIWLDGDQLDNSMVSELAHQSMSGTLNLQFSSSADLIPSNNVIKE